MIYHGPQGWKRYSVRQYLWKTWYCCNIHQWLNTCWNKNGTELGILWKNTAVKENCTDQRMGYLQELNRTMFQMVYYWWFPRTVNQATMLKEWLAQGSFHKCGIFVYTRVHVPMYIVCPIQKPKVLSYYYHKLKVLARSETDLTPIFVLLTEPD